MSKVLFLNIPAYGHVNPTLGIVNELVKSGQEVIYFCTEEFRERIEKAGAVFKSYGNITNDLNANKNHFNVQNITLETAVEFLNNKLSSCEKSIESILEQIEDIKFDYVGYASVCPLGKIMSQILHLPSFSSFAVFATPKEIAPKLANEINEETLKKYPVMDTYKKLSHNLKEKYNITIPKITDLFFSKGDVNFVYTSKYFVRHIEYYDDTFKFIGPPIYDRKENTDNFPYKEIKGKKVIYISLGTVFSGTNINLYDIFFKALKDEDAVVVMTAYNVDLSEFDIPQNFIVRNYISQSEILKYASAAITHCGMNSTNDLLVNNVPFVAIPLGADQTYMASRSAELGACISLDKDKLTPELLKSSLNKILSDPNYSKNINKINESFRESGGYKKAAQEILNLGCVLNKCL
ncbi:macrolide family glycosyltransferase [Clostridium neuense]|uniref:Macrolide family glycosyltransferase n=1 Tax=Clostridium neuense TaxID=1728934 RepID=A0ABW8TKF2_9CLOT